jgi:arylsulfatase
MLTVVKEVATRTIPHTAPFLLTTDETFDVGVDTCTPVDDNDYRVPFPFSGKLEKVTVTLEPKMLPPELVEMEKRLRQGERQN